MTDITDTDRGREALEAYLKDCDDHAIVPDVGGAFHYAFMAGRASLAANAGSEPVALNPRHIRKFLQALQAGEMSVGRAVEILDAWVGGYYSDDMVPPPPSDTCLIADDEFPMEIVRKLRREMSTHPSPPEGMVMVPRVLPLDGPIRDVLIEWIGRAVKGECYLYADFWAALISAAPPLPASEAKEL